MWLVILQYPDKILQIELYTEKSITNNMILLSYFKKRPMAAQNTIVPTEIY